MVNSEESIGLSIAKRLLEEMPCVPPGGGQVTGEPPGLGVLGPAVERPEWTRLAPSSHPLPFHHHRDRDSVQKTLFM